MGGVEATFSAIDAGNMDLSVSPKEDFYSFVNGSWMQNTTIPKDLSSWGGFDVLKNATDKTILALLKDVKASQNYALDSDQIKAYTLFNIAMDTLSRNRAGITPFQSALDAIESVETLSDLQTVIANNPAVTAPFFGVEVGASLTDSSRNEVYLGPNSLGLDHRDYYILEDNKSVEIREKYKKYIARILHFLGDSKAEAEAAAVKILAMEKALAIPRFDKDQARDLRNYNNPCSLVQIDKKLSSIHLRKMVREMGITKKFDTLIVTQLKYVEALNTFLEKTSIDDLKMITRWNTFNSAAALLSTDIESVHWEFYSQYLKGAKKQKDYEEIALRAVNKSMGESIGQIYIKATFPPEAKIKAQLMAENIIEAYKLRIQNLEWMSSDTKLEAIEKLNRMIVKIAYPDTWEDYSSMEISEDKSYFENIIAVNDWNQLRNYAKVGEPVDKEKWSMSPQTVNAYYNASNNEIVFPAAILQAPFFNFSADEAVNYGGIGAIIGHEISHAFDDSGARFDCKGNLRNWWTDKDFEAFETAGTALTEQYNAIGVSDGLFINGKYTLGENIADLGGVLAAFDGLQKFYGAHGRPENIDGLTPEQRFFMSWTTVWRSLIRDRALLHQVKTDTHAPSKVRATQPLKNIDAFYKAFDIKKGDPMYLAPNKRVRIW